jgi:hypothetical protein
VGLFDRLFRRSAPPPAMQETSSTDVQEIVQAYAASMSKTRSLVSDASELPYPKPQIKAALIAAISATQDAKMRERLKAAFVSLADWQEGVGAGPYSFESTTKMAKRIAVSGPTLTEISARVTAEGQALLDELKLLGL